MAELNTGNGSKFNVPGSTFRASENFESFLPFKTFQSFKPFKSLRGIEEGNQ